MTMIDTLNCHEAWPQRRQELLGGI